MKRRIFLTAGAAFLASASAQAQNSWLDRLRGVTKRSSGVSALTQSEAVDGLKAALRQGAQVAIDQLGRDNGFLDNLDVRIPVPEKLRVVERGLRTVGQDKLADDFVSSMNHAAERAVPIAADVFANAIGDMTIDDGLAILNGGDDAATEYLRRSSSDSLRTRFQPLVSDAMDEVGVTRSYQNFVGKGSTFGNLFGSADLDLNEYVTDKALDGVFHMIATEERRIRENPVARTSDLLKKVFGRTGTD